MARLNMKLLQQDRLKDVGDMNDLELLSALDEDKEPLSDEDAVFFEVSSSSTAPQHKSSSALSVLLWDLTPPTQ